MNDRPFHPHPLLSNPHIMTVLPALNPRPHSVLRKSQKSILIDVDSHSKVLLHYHEVKQGAPWLLIVHGLEGSSCATYLLNLASKALPLGINVGRLNLRNCGGTMHLTPTLYNAGMSDDVIAVANFLRTKMSAAAIYLAGYSLGGNIALKAAAESGNNALDRVCAISPAVDLDACVTAIERGINRMYEWRFMLGLREKIKAKSMLYPDRFDLQRLKRVTGIRSFDDNFTAPDGGYEDAAHYYRSASALTRLHEIKVPTLIIAAQDDPLVPFDSFLTDHLNAPQVSLLAPKSGGHGGFVHKDIELSPHSKFRDRLWAENRAVEFFISETYIKDDEEPASSPKNF